LGETFGKRYKHDFLDFCPNETCEAIQKTNFDGGSKRFLGVLSALVLVSSSTNDIMRDFKCEGRVDISLRKKISTVT
jgi:hypothetical protein